MPAILATSIIRTAKPGESHGSFFLVDLDGRRGVRWLDWKRRRIDWNGAVGGRGLRGIAIDGERIFIGGDGELFEFSPDLSLVATHGSPYLGQCAEIACHEGRLYVVSAAFDAVLAFDIETRRFDRGLYILGDEAGLRAKPFDPGSSFGPGPQARLGLGSVWCDARGLFVAGERTLGLLHFEGKRIARLVTLPAGVRNARPWRDGVLFNDSAAGCTRFLTPQANQVFPAPRLPRGELQQAEDLEAGDAPLQLLQGLCVIEAGLVAAGSSPAAITLHDFDTMKTVLNISLTLDVREAIHSLHLWPFDLPEEPRAAVAGGVSG